MTRDAFTVGMANLMVWYKPHPSDLELEYYFTELEAMDDDDFTAIVDDIIKHRHFPDFPKPADFWIVHESMCVVKPAVTSDALRDKYACQRCYDTPGWITYFVTPEGKRTDDPMKGNFTASPCPECALGATIMTEAYPKKPGGVNG
jgi:hypothetical protein